MDAYDRAAEFPEPLRRRIVLMIHECECECLAVAARGLGRCDEEAHRGERAACAALARGMGAEAVARAVEARALPPPRAAG